MRAIAISDTLLARSLKLTSCYTLFRKKKYLHLLPFISSVQRKSEEQPTQVPEGEPLM
jgi:hypothetical protein